MLSIAKTLSSSATKISKEQSASNSLMSLLAAKANTNFCSYRAQKSYVPSTREPIVYLQALAKDELRNGHYEHAIKLYEKAIDQHFQKTQVKEDNITANLRLKIALTYQDTEKPGRALSYFQSALEVFRNDKNEAESTIHCLQGLGQSFANMGHTSVSLDWRNKALDFAIEIFGTNHRLTGYSYLNISQAYVDMEETKTALSLAKKAQQILGSTLVANHEWNGKSFELLGCIQLRLSKKESALKHYKKALKIYMLTLGSSHPKSVHTFQIIQNLKISETTLNPMPNNSSGQQFHLVNEMLFEHTKSNSHDSSEPSVTLNHSLGKTEQIKELHAKLKKLRLTENKQGANDLGLIEELFTLYEQTQSFSEGLKHLQFYYEAIEEQYGRGAVESINLQERLIKFYVKTGKTEEILEILKCTLALCQKTGTQIRLQIHCQKNISKLFQSLNQSQTAINYQKNVVKLLKQSEYSTTQIIHESMILGDMYMQAYSYLESLKSYMESFKLLDPADNEFRLQALLLEKIGDAFSCLGNNQQAYSSYLNAQRTWLQHKAVFEHKFQDINDENSYKQLDRKIQKFKN